MASQGSSKLLTGSFSLKAEVSIYRKYPLAPTSECNLYPMQKQQHFNAFLQRTRTGKVHDTVVLFRDSRKEWFPEIKIGPPEFCHPKPERVVMLVPRANVQDTLSSALQEFSRLPGLVAGSLGGSRWGSSYPHRLPGRTPLNSFQLGLGQYIQIATDTW